MNSLAAYLLLIAAEPFVVGDLRTFGDWTVGCDYRIACHAISHPEEEFVGDDEDHAADGRLSLTIKSTPVPGQDPVVVFTLLEPNHSVVSAQDLAVAIDGTPVAAPLDGSGGLFSLSARDSHAFVVAAAQGRAVALVDRSGNEIGSASLRGLRDVLAFVDGQQYRTGTTSAFARPGTLRWDYSVAPVLAPSTPVRVAARSERPPTRVSPAVLAQLMVEDPCNGSSPEPEVEPPQYYRLDARNSLLILTTRCGGYNPYRMLFIIDEKGHATAARFRPYPGGPRSEDPDLPDPGWDEDARRLRTFGRGRVLADCGEAAEYVWDRGAFRLVRFSSLYPCRGSYDYITTFDWPVEIAAESDGSRTDRRRENSNAPALPSATRPIERHQDEGQDEVRAHSFSGIG